MLVLAVGVTVVLFVKAAEIEGKSTILWGGMSVAVWALTIFVLGWSVRGGLLGQVCLFVGITLFRVWRDARRKN